MLHPKIVDYIFTATCEGSVAGCQFPHHPKPPSQGPHLRRFLSAVLGQEVEIHR